MNKVFATLAAIAIISAPATLNAQELKHHHGKHSTPQVFGAVQMNYEYQQDGLTNGLSLGAARVGVKGQVNPLFSYLVEYDVATQSTEEILVGFRAPADIDLTAGLMRVPFGIEASAHVADQPFVGLSQMSEEFGIGNSVGVSASRTLGKRAAVTAALLQESGSDEVYVGRVSIDATDMITLGGAIATTEGETRYAADATVEYGKFSLMGEYATRTSDINIDEVYAYYATLGYTITPKTSVQARYDAHELFGENLVLGYALTTGKNADLTINYGMPTSDLGETELHRLTAQFQVRF